jgi:hypothetical protein
VGISVKRPDYSVDAYFALLEHCPQMDLADIEAEARMYLDPADAVLEGGGLILPDPPTLKDVSSG